MVRKTEDKKNVNEEKIFKTWADSYTAISKMWEDSYVKLYKPWIESTGELFEKTALLSKEATPQKYREFYEDWMKTYQNTFGKLYPIPTLKNNKETLQKFLSGAEESSKLYRSWTMELEENSRKTKEILQGEPDPAKYKECYEMWMKSYEKIFDELLELPDKESTKEIFGNYMSIPDIYSGSFLKMSKLWKKSYAQVCGPFNESMLKLSEKMAEISRGDSGPEAYKEFYTLWMDTYEKAFESFFDDMPTVGGPMKNIMEPVKIMAKMYADAFTNFSKMWVRSGVSSAPAYPGKYKK